MYIIIGASSFIGVYTADEFLKQGCEIIVTGRKNKFKEHYDKLGVKYVNLDLTNEADFEQLPKEGVEGVILLSGLLPANAEVNLDEDENAADEAADNRCGDEVLLEELDLTLDEAAEQIDQNGKTYGLDDVELDDHERILLVMFFWGSGFLWSQYSI